MGCGWAVEGRRMASDSTQDAGRDPNCLSRTIPRPPTLRLLVYNSRPFASVAVMSHRRALRQPTKAGQAPAPSGRAGHRRFQHDRRRRQRHGVPVRRQGLVRAARHADRAAAQGPGELRTGRCAPRPEAARLSGRGAAELSGDTGHSVCDPASKTPTAWSRG